MYFSFWLDINASRPFESINHTSNPNSDFRFKRNSSIKKIQVKTWNFSGVMDNFLEEESEVKIDSKTNLIISEKRKSYGRDESTFMAFFSYDITNFVTKIERIAINNNKRLELIEFRKVRNSIIQETDSHIFTHTYDNNKLIEVKTYIKSENSYDMLIKIFYDTLNRIIKVEEYSYFQDVYNDYGEYDKSVNLENPKLFFILHYEYCNTENDGLMISEKTVDLIDEVSKKKVYFFNEYGDKVSEEIFNAENQKQWTVNYLYSYDNYGNWIKLEKRYIDPKTNTTDVAKIFERIIKYNDFC